MARSCRMRCGRYTLPTPVLVPLVGLLILFSCSTLSDACQLILFRHFQKCGGTAIRTYFEYYQPPWTYCCTPQFTRGQSHFLFSMPKYKTSSREDVLNAMVVHLEKLRKDLDASTAESKQSHRKALNTKGFIEVHINEFVQPNETMVLLDVLGKLRDETSCQVLTFAVVRDPIHHAWSDFRFFRKKYEGYEGNFTAFLLDHPENLLRRMNAFGVGDFVYGNESNGRYPIDIETYKDDQPLQFKLYRDMKHFLSKFDLVAPMERFDDLWGFLCRYADLGDDEFHLTEDIPPQYNVFHSNKKCAELAQTGVNRNYHPKGEEDELTTYEKIANMMNPISNLLYQEAVKAFNQTLIDLQVQGDESIEDSLVQRMI